MNEAGGTGLARSALVSRAGLSYRKADAAVARLTKGGAATLIGTMLVSPRACTELGERLLAALRAHHETHPHAGGMPREEARERLFRRVAPEIFEAVLDGLVSARRLVARDRLALAGQGVSLSDDRDAGAGGAGAGLSRRRVDAAGSRDGRGRSRHDAARWPSA